MADIAYSECCIVYSYVIAALLNATNNNSVCEYGFVSYSSSSENGYFCTTDCLFVHWFMPWWPETKFCSVMSQWQPLIYNDLGTWTSWTTYEDYTVCYVILVLYGSCHFQETRWCVYTSANYMLCLGLYPMILIDVYMNMVNNARYSLYRLQRNMLYEITTGYSIIVLELNMLYSFRNYFWYRLKIKMWSFFILFDNVELKITNMLGFQLVLFTIAGF